MGSRAVASLTRRSSCCTRPFPCLLLRASWSEHVFYEMTRALDLSGVWKFGLNRTGWMVVLHSSFLNRLSKQKHGWTGNWGGLLGITERNTLDEKRFHFFFSMCVDIFSLQVIEKCK